MKTLLKYAALACLWLGVATIARGGQPLAQFQGSWANENTASKGIVKLMISVSGSNVQVQTFGSCSPTPCDWGKQPGTAFAKDVTTSVISNTEKIMATYNSGFSVSTLIIEPAGTGRIRVSDMTRFTDNSGRSNYTMTEYFKKAPEVLPAPQLLSPPCGSVFDHYPRKTTLSWSKVTGAKAYTIEIDCFQCCESGKWCTDVGKTYRLLPNMNTTSYTFDFVGAQPGRWRVWAIAADGKEGLKSAWCEFRYTR